MKSYIMYHCHSDYSLLDSATNFQDYVDLAVQNNMRALSISEHGIPWNWCEKWAACKAAGIKYIHSVEIYLTENLDEKVRDNYHTVLMAKNMEGVKELNKLISMSSDERHFYYVNRISFEEFLEISDNIISTSACLASPLNKLDESNPFYEKLVRKYDFLEVQAHSHPDQRAFNEKLLGLSKKYDKLLIAGTDTHSSSKYKADCRSILMHAKGKTYGDEDYFDLSFKTYDELADMFARQGALPEDEYIRAIENTNLLYEMCDDIELDCSIKYPILYGSYEEDRKRFEQTVAEKFEDKIRTGVIPSEQKDGFEKAIAEEMEVFKKLDMCGFMLSESEMISWCKDQGMAIGPARGSVAGSRIAYITDIIDLNPETWHTNFARFANVNRVEPGDIDVDVVESDRPKIFQYLINRFGEAKTARVASFGTLQSKAVIDEIGRALAKKWMSETENADNDKNPWSLANIASIKKEFESNPEKARDKYPELFYYYDGLVGVKISKSVHPAGMVLSPVLLKEEYGCYLKDDEPCLFLDMDNAHEVGLVKYDLLILKTVQVIRDTCRYIGIPYPKMHEVDWNDEKVWANMARDRTGIFQMESSFAGDSLRKFKPKNLFELSLLTACIRPSGTSYRDDLIARKPHHNPSKIIDDLLANNNGYLVYQCDIIAFLQQICGFSGSDADSIRRAIGKKKREEIDAAMPKILEGYCSKSDKSREIAEQEAKEFMQILEDSSSYMFGYNHSLAYCMLTYLCAYYRYHYPLEFLTSFLNNAANDDDIQNGTAYANKIGIQITMPKWGVSRSDYYFSKDRQIIAKGLASIKFIGKKDAKALYELSQGEKFTRFVDLLAKIENEKILDTRQIGILVRLDFFSEFGNQKELLEISRVFYGTFKKGAAKKIRMDSVAGSILEPIIQKYSLSETKSGAVAKSYTIVDMDSILHESEDAIKQLNLPDIDVLDKCKNFSDIMGYAGYVSGRQEDRPKLYISDILPLRRKKDGKEFGYSVRTKSIGSGKDSSMTVFNNIYNKNPIKKGDIIYCKRWRPDRGYFLIEDYEILGREK